MHCYPIKGNHRSSKHLSTKIISQRYWKSENVSSCFEKLSACSYSVEHRDIYLSLIVFFITCFYKTQIWAWRFSEAAWTSSFRYFHVLRSVFFGVVQGLRSCFREESSKCAEEKEAPFFLCITTPKQVSQWNLIWPTWVMFQGSFFSIL